MPSGARVGLLGCGVVGSEVAAALCDATPPIQRRVNLRRVAVRNLRAKRGVELTREMLTDDPMAVVEDPAVSVVIELLGGLDPAEALVSRALELGKPVVTANKQLVSSRGRELRRLSHAHQVPLAYGAAVGGGLPCLELVDTLRAGDMIHRIDGVLNGTSNYVLSIMEREGVELAEALVRARNAGTTEADAKRDLDGRDAADKVAILAHHAFDSQATSDDVDRLGIEWLGSADINAAHRRGQRWRLVATAIRQGCLRVEPTLLPEEHPLAQVPECQNRLVVASELAGVVIASGTGAGGPPTASAVLADLARINAAMRE